MTSARGRGAPYARLTRWSPSGSEREGVAALGVVEQEEAALVVQDDARSPAVRALAVRRSAVRTEAARRRARHVFHRSCGVRIGPAEENGLRRAAALGVLLEACNPLRLRACRCRRRRGRCRGNGRGRGAGVLLRDGRRSGSRGALLRTAGSARSAWSAGRDRGRRRRRRGRRRCCGGRGRCVGLSLRRIVRAPLRDDVHACARDDREEDEARHHSEDREERRARSALRRSSWPDRAGRVLPRIVRRALLCALRQVRLLHIPGVARCRVGAGRKFEGGSTESPGDGS